MYFHSIFNDHSNYSSTALLLKKDQAYKHFKDFQAWLELKSDNKVMNVWCNSTKKFISGKLKNHLDKKGISLQSTAAYAY